MYLELFNEQINIRLLKGLVNFIYGSNMDNEHAQQHIMSVYSNFFYKVKSGEAQNIQSDYNIRYLGELLENYEARGLNKCDFRALAIGYALCEEFVNDAMFVGNQQRNFVNAVIKSYNGDFDMYLAYALIKLDIQAKERIHDLTVYSYETLSQIIIALTMAKDIQQTKLFFENFRPQINDFLLHGHSTVIDHADLFALLVQLIQDEVKSLRSKDAAILKAFCALPYKRMAKESGHCNILLSSHYSALDIAYLNYLMPKKQKDGDSVYGRPLYQKIVCDYVAAGLSDPDTLHQKHKAILGKLLEDYVAFHPAFDGYSGIVAYIKANVKLQNEDTYLWLLNLEIDGLSVYDPLFGFDILHDKKDGLLKGMTRIQLLSFLNETILDMQIEEVQKAETEQIIQKVKIVTGVDYIESFSIDNSAYYAFKKMVEMGFIQLDEWILVYDTLSEILQSNIKRFLEGAHSRYAFDILKSFIRQFGVKEYKKLFGDDFHKVFFSHRQYQDSSIHYKRDFLAPEEYYEFIHWIEESIYLFEPDGYIDFIKCVVLDRLSTDIFPEIELKEIIGVVEPHLKSYELKKLGNLKFTPEELAEREKAEVNREKELAYQKEQEEIKIIRLEWERTNTDTISSIWNYLERANYEDTYKKHPKLYYEIAVSYSKKLLSDIAAIKQEEFIQLSTICLKALKNGVLDVTGYMTLLEKGAEQCTTTDAS